MPQKQQVVRTIFQTARRFAVIAGLVLFAIGIGFSATVYPFIEKAPVLLRQFWFGWFVATFVLMLLAIPRWQCLVALGAVIFTVFLWAGV